ncbi:DUF3157 family protein [Vibrio aquimaris]|uniref:Uncharacterized protein n=1 Tax=Vibrio aquimaris TaxID=2587862 RepID=A0A5P9CGB0_9VIBR|nr:DUF3157 family protein [Vibrio aquimaris]QFT24903.1 hypothetical protein FIV01_00295 [Vibrio aquimaris]
MYKAISLLTILAASTVMADQTVTLNDGRQVILNDNFTWQYVAQTSPDKAESLTSDKPQLAAIPLIDKKIGSMVKLDSNHPIMQLSDSGVDVLLGAPSYVGSKLIIPTSITNQSLNSVILIEIEIEVSGIDKKVFTKKSVKIWQSIKRMPDTYLRPQQMEQGKDIELEVVKQDQYLISANITSLINR